MPSVSVLMAVRNCERYIYDSMVSIIRQTFQDFEFIIIDDASTDGTAEIIASFRDQRIHVIKNQKNYGLARSLNLGIVRANGKYIARQDADDISLPERLAIQYLALEEDPELFALGGKEIVIGKNGYKIFSASRYRTRTKVGTRFQMMFSNPLVHSSVMFRRKKRNQELFLYNEKWKRGQDYELWARIAEEGDINNIDKRVVRYRVHDVSVSARRISYNERLADAQYTMQMRLYQKLAGSFALTRVNCILWSKSWINVSLNITNYTPQKNEIEYMYNTIKAQLRHLNDRCNSKNEIQDCKLVASRALFDLGDYALDGYPVFGIKIYLSAFKLGGLDMLMTSFRKIGKVGSLICRKWIGNCQCGAFVR